MRLHVEVSPGEAVDKQTILLSKQARLGGITVAAVFGDIEWRAPGLDHPAAAKRQADAANQQTSES